ncbi:MAG: hypothetical protein RLZZ24_1509 [Pseudomonadota bacterium]
MIGTLFFLVSALLVASSGLACTTLAAERYNVSPALLQAIAQHESGGPRR